MTQADPTKQVRGRAKVEPEHLRFANNLSTGEIPNDRFSNTGRN